jgi:hypothetical protein
MIKKLRGAGDLLCRVSLHMGLTPVVDLGIFGRGSQGLGFLDVI